MNHVDFSPKECSNEIKNQCTFLKKKFKAQMVMWCDIHAKGRQRAMKLLGIFLLATTSSIEGGSQLKDKLTPKYSSFMPKNKERNAFHGCVGIE